MIFSSGGIISILIKCSQGVAERERGWIGVKKALSAPLRWQRG